MFLLRTKTTFDASHLLPSYEGKCSKLHGHTYHVEVVWKYKNTNSKTAMAEDFKILKQFLKEEIKKYDHEHLNSIFTSDPTAELIAKEIFLNLKEKNRHVYEVTIWETPNNGVTFKEEK
jgi:6-pyruvoyltetrahydropterin/6-carboxytetrahydropterin synthase